MSGDFGDFHDGGWEPPLDEYDYYPEREPQVHPRLEAGCITVLAAVSLAFPAFALKHVIFDEPAAKGYIREAHSAAMRAAADRSLVDVYNMQFIQESEYRLSSGRYAGAYAKIGNFCLKETEFNPSHDGAAITQLNPNHLKISAYNGRNFRLIWDNDRAQLVPQSSKDEDIVEEYDCDYDITYLKLLLRPRGWD